MYQIESDEFSEIDVTKIINDINIKIDAGVFPDTSIGSPSSPLDTKL